MSYRYLTRSYVDWLGLQRIPILKARSNTAHSFVGETLPRPDQSPLCEGVQHDGVLYERESDGLAYVRL